MKKISIIICVLTLLFTSTAFSLKADELIDESIPSAILIEASTGKVLFEKNADERMIPASVTKVMTMLLIMEAIESGSIGYDDTVSASAKAASMGGSQVYLKEGEEFSVNDMLKAITMASANDACVAMAEFLAGSEDAFVELMNNRAAELGMSNTNFENSSGLDDTVENHYTSARDIAIMSSELIDNHPKILEYTSVWMDTLRDGAFGLTNTNRLVRFYNGANGLKTGSTSKAGFCISAAALRDGVQLIAVIMKAPDRDTRNEAAKRLLDYGFANYTTVSFDADTVSDQKIYGAAKKTSDFYIPPYKDILPKNKADSVVKKIKIDKEITAPVKNGQKVGMVEYYLDDKLIHEDDILSSEEINKITYLGMVIRIFKEILVI